MQIRKATRKQAKLRCALIGISGAGKTYSALKLAKGMGLKTCVIDTESGSASLYANEFDFDIIELTPPFSPDRYVKAINMIENEGYECVIIDSLSHAWAGSGGILDIQDAKTRSSAKGNSYTAWRDVTPLHNKLVDTILQSRCHIIATMRTKTHYDMQDNEKGKKTPIKIGLSPVQREGLEYEFTVIFDLSQENYASCTKDRTSLFKGKDFIISEETGIQLKDWMNTGEEWVDGEKYHLMLSEEVRTLSESALKEGLIDAEKVSLCFIKDKVNNWHEMNTPRLETYKQKFIELINSSKEPI